MNSCIMRNKFSTFGKIRDLMDRALHDETFLNRHGIFQRSNTRVENGSDSSLL